MLADFTVPLTIYLARELGISHTRFLRSSDTPSAGRKTDRLVPLLKHAKATHYFSGPSAKVYLEEYKLHDIGVSVEFMEYRYGPYPQPHPPFDPHVSVLDLLFAVGPAAADYIWNTEPTPRRAE